MAIQAAPRVLLLGVVCALFSPAAIHSQIPRRLKRCLPYPTFAQEIEKANEGTNQEASQPPVVIDAVKFDGPIHLSEAARETLVAELKQHPFRSGSKWINEIEEVAVRGAWQDEGYFNANVHARAQVLSADETAQHVSLTITVDEGLQYRLAGIEFRNADPETSTAPFSADELRKAIPMRDGDIFNVSKIREGLDALRKLYDSEGYIDFTSEPLMDVDDARQLISLVLELDEQRQFRIGKVEILGLDPKMESLLRSKVEPGAVFNFQAIEDFYRDNKAILPANASPTDDEVVRKVNVKEATVDLVFDFRTCPLAQD